MGTIEKDSAKYYLEKIKSGYKTLDDIDDGRVRKEVRQQIKKSIIDGTSNDNAMKAFARWMKSTNTETIPEASLEVNAAISSIIKNLP